MRFFVIFLAGCGQQYWSNGVRPEPKGEARVVLVARAGAWVPVACYDPDWVRLVGPADCADLIPPGAEVRVLTGEIRRLGARRPDHCPGALAVGFPDEAAAGLAVWPADTPATPTAIDLDADGRPERLEVSPGGLVVWGGEQIIGACRNDK